MNRPGSFQHYEIAPPSRMARPWELGRGTMGVTYKAFDVNLCCEVALKVVNAALLDHPHMRGNVSSAKRAPPRHCGTATLRAFTISGMTGRRYLLRDGVH